MLDQKLITTLLTLHITKKAIIIIIIIGIRITLIIFRLASINVRREHFSF